jgi:hypothetical protein
MKTRILFVDLVKAFDTVSRDTLFAVLRSHGLPKPFFEYHNSTSQERKDHRFYDGIH